MKKEDIKECIRLTEDVMIRHFQGDSEFAISLMHKNCIWIGSCASEFYQGKEEIVKVLRAFAGTLPTITLTSQEYMCASHDTHECVITGRHIGQTTRYSGEIYRDMQRITFVWKKTREGLQIMHIHVSNPMNNLKDDEIFPHQIGTYTKEYFNLLVSNDIKKTGKITVKDQLNRHHVIKIGDISYIEAFDMKCIIHLEDNDIFARIPLLEIEALIKKKNNNLFKRIHKSYLINKYHVKSLERYTITLQRDVELPVSKERYGEIRDWLHE